MSMRRGSFAFSTPMLWAIGGIVVAGIAGLNVIVVVNAGTNRVFHDTYFVVAHMDYLLSQAAVFGVFAGWYYLFPKVTGYAYSDVLGKTHFWLSFIGVNTMYVPSVLILWDMGSRIGDAPDDTLRRWNLVASIGSYIFAAGFVVFLANMALSFWRRRPAP